MIFKTKQCCFHFSVVFNSCYTIWKCNGIKYHEGPDDYYVHTCQRRQDSQKFCWGWGLNYFLVDNVFTESSTDLSREAVVPEPVFLREHNLCVDRNWSTYSSVFQRCGKIIFNLCIFVQRILMGSKVKPYPTTIAFNLLDFPLISADDDPTLKAGLVAAIF